MTAERCGARYRFGPRGRRTCRRLAGHPGQHSHRLSIAELRRLTGR